MKEKWFTLDVPESECLFWESKERAKEEAEKILAEYRDMAASDGWPEEEEFVMWGRVMGWNTKCEIETKATYEADGEEWPYNSDFDEIYNMKLIEDE